MGEGRVQGVYIAGFAEQFIEQVNHVDFSGSLHCMRAMPINQIFCQFTTNWRFSIDVYWANLQIAK